MRKNFQSKQIREVLKRLKATQIAVTITGTALRSSLFLLFFFFLRVLCAFNVLIFDVCFTSLSFEIPRTFRLPFFFENLCNFLSLCLHFIHRRTFALTSRGFFFCFFFFLFHVARLGCCCCDSKISFHLFLYFFPPRFAFARLRKPKKNFSSRDLFLR